jgi:TonB family protein
MTSPVVRAAITVIRLWTTFYTFGLPPQVRDRRREEILSDVWHHVSDCEDHPVRLAAQLIARIVLGSFDDLGWRFEQRHVRWSWMTVAAAATPIAVAVIVAWMLSASLPVPPDPPSFNVHAQSSPSPPPPPPPPPPDGRSGSGPVVDFSYGETSYTVIPEAAAPARVKEVRPIYPPILKAAAVEGVVVVQGTITEEGRVMDAHLVQPAGLLGQSAIAAISQWQFTPSKPAYRRSQRLLTVSVTFSSRK